MAGEQRQDPLAYGDFHQGRPAEEQEGGEYEGGERGIVGDTFRKLRNKYQKPASNDPGQNVTQAYQPHLHGQSTAQPSRPSQSGNSSQQPASIVSSIFDKLHDVVHGLGAELKQSLAGEGQTHSHTHEGAMCSDGMHDDNQHRYGSFAAQRNGNDVKWYVDGCGYMWAVSRALEQARESIWILDCELSIWETVKTHLNRQGGFPPSCIFEDHRQETSNIALTESCKQPRSAESKSTSSSTRKSSRLLHVSTFLRHCQNIFIPFFPVGSTLSRRL